MLPIVSGNLCNRLKLRVKNCRLASSADGRKFKQESHISAEGCTEFGGQLSEFVSAEVDGLEVREFAYQRL